MHIGIGAMAALDRVFHFLPRPDAQKKRFWKEAPHGANGIEDSAEQS